MVKRWRRLSMADRYQFKLGTTLKESADTKLMRYSTYLWSELTALRQTAREAWDKHQKEKK
mgnify:CR=1 FL=1